MSEIAPPADLDTPVTPTDEAPPEQDDAAAASSPPSLGVDESASPPSEPTPTPPPERTWQNVVEDYNAWLQGDKTRALSAGEFNQVQTYITQRQQATQAETQQQQRIAQAFPSTAKGLLSDVASMTGITEGTAEYLALQKVIDDRILHGNGTEPSLHSVASNAVLGPVYDAQTGWLFEKLGRTNEAAQYIRTMGATDMLQAAHDIGARTAGRAQVETLDDAKIDQLAKGQLKAAGKNLPFEGVEKAIKQAIKIERDANPDRYLPEVGAEGTKATGSGLTYAQVLKMTPAQVNAIPPDVYLRVLESAR